MRMKRDRRGRKAYRTKSGLLKNTIEDSGIEDNIPLLAISKSCMFKIIEYLNYINSNEPPFIHMPLKSNNFSE